MNTNKGFKVFDPSSEEGLKNLINLGKSAVQPENAGFLEAVKSAGIAPEAGVGLSATLSVRDSAEDRGITGTGNQSVTTETKADEEGEGQEPEALLDPGVVSDLLKSAIAEAVAEAVEPVQSQLDEVKQSKEALEAELSEAKQSNEKLTSDLTAARNAQTVLGALSNLTGKKQMDKPPSGPAFVHSNPLREHPKGLADELISIIEKQSNGEVRRSRENKEVHVYDPRQAQSFLVRSLREDYAAGRPWRQSEIVKSLEAWGKDIGFLSGSNATRAAGPTTGASGSAPALFLDALSALTRATHTSMNVWWQFAISAYDPSAAPSKTVLVPRFHYLADPTDITAYETAGFDSYTGQGIVVGTGSDSQSLEVSDVPIGIKQYQLGKSGSVGTRPVFVPEFHEAIALTSLLDAVDSRLMQNYYKFENLLIRLRYEANTKIKYNNAGEVETTATNISTGDSGAMTKEFLYSVYTEMLSSQIPTFPSGMYALVLNPTALKQLKNSLQDQWHPATNEQIMEVTNIMSTVHGLEIGRVSGYQGDYCGFHVFMDNSFGVGAAGSVPTVNNVTFEAAIGARVTNDSFAFGPGAVGRGVALPVQIRSSGTVPFNLGEAFIWLSWEAAADMDNDVAIDADQQTRVFKLRTARVAF